MAPSFLRTSSVKDKLQQQIDVKYMIDVNPLLSNGKTSYVILDVNPVYMIKNIHQSKYKVIKTKKVLTFITIKST